MDLNDQRIKDLDAEKAAALTNSNATFDQMLADSANLTQQNNQWMEEWKKTQDNLTNQQVAFNQGQLENKKTDADNEFKKEAVASNVDYKKLINPYGVQAENQAQQGLNGTGFSESSKVNAWNTSQNRTALARATTQKIKADFDAQITQARLTGDAQLAENALKVLEQRMANAQREFEFGSATKQNQLNFNTQLDNTYYGRYQDVFKQQDYEQEQKAAQERFQQELELKKQQDEQAQSNWQAEYNASVAASQTKAASGGSSAKTKAPAVSTPYYQGDKNPYAQYGTFQNGYQPNNLGYIQKGDKKVLNMLTASTDAKGKKETVAFNTTDLNGNTQTVTQTVWKDLNGKKWIWEGRQNKYIPF